MSDIEQVQGKLDIGRVFGDAFGMLRRQFAPLVLVVIVFSILPSTLNLTLNFRGLGEARLPSPGYWLGMLLGTALACFSYAFQFHLAVSDLSGEDPSWRRSLRVALSKMLPVLALLVVWALGVGLGWVLVIVPGVILMTMWAVSMPAVVSEPVGPIKALGRSRALTKNNRWRVFGVLILLLIVIFVADMVIMTAMLPARLAQGGPTPGVGAIVLTFIIGTIMGLLVVGLLSALYVQLRSLKEGLGGASAAVFD